MGSLGFLTNHDFKSMHDDLNEVIYGSEALEQCSIDGSVSIMSTCGSRLRQHDAQMANMLGGHCHPESVLCCSRCRTHVSLVGISVFGCTCIPPSLDALVNSISEWQSSARSITVYDQQLA